MTSSAPASPSSYTTTSSTSASPSSYTTTSSTSVSSSTSSRTNSVAPSRSCTDASIRELQTKVLSFCRYRPIPLAARGLQALQLRHRDASPDIQAIFELGHSIIVGRREQSNQRIEGCTRALRTGATNPDVLADIYYQLGMHHKALGQVTEARRTLTLASQQRASDSLLRRNIFFALGELLFDQRQFAEAATALEQSGKDWEPPDQAYISHMIGMAYKYTEQHEKALQFYTNAEKSLDKAKHYESGWPEGVTHESLYISINLDCGIVQEEMGDIFPAQVRYRRVLSKQISDRLRRFIVVRMGCIKVAGGRANEVFNIFQRYARSNTNEPDTKVQILKQIGVEFISRGQLDLAEKTFKKATTIEGSSDRARATAYHQLGLVQYRQEKPDEAEKTFQQEITALTAHPELQALRYSWLGNEYAERGEVEKARDAFEKALALDPQDNFRNHLRERLRSLNHSQQNNDEEPSEEGEESTQASSKRVTP